MTLRIGRNAIAASIMVVGGGLSTAATANPVLNFNNLFGWVAGTQSCTDRSPQLGGADGAGMCDGSPTGDIIQFSDNVAELGPDAFGTASWRNFDEAQDGIPADDPLSFLEARGFADSLAPGETKVISEFFHDNNVLSPFGEAFDWEMELRNRLILETAGGMVLLDTGAGPATPTGGQGQEFTFGFVETLNFLNPDDCPETFADQRIGDQGCNDRWTGTGTNVLTATIPVGLLFPALFADPNANLEILVESEGELVVDRDEVNPIGDIVVHTAEPIDSTLRFLVRYNAVNVPEPATISMVAAGLLLVSGAAARRRRNS